MDCIYGQNDETIVFANFNFQRVITKNIISYQIIQNYKGKAELLLIVNNNFTLEENLTLKSNINKQVRGVIDFEIKVVDKLIFSNRGKFKMFINNINE